MNVNFQYSAILFLLLLVIPVAIFLLHTHNIINLSQKGKFSFTGRMRIRTACWLLAWVFAVIALAGPSWGEKPVEVYKSGTSAIFVFDISYSMLAEDVGLSKKISRLAASELFMQNLLKYISGTTVGGVLAKGDGILAVPLTEDYYALENLVQMLSPNLVSAPGSSIAKGIETAIAAFPPQSAHNSVIVVCTDGDETDNALSLAVKKAASYGIQVILVGFGSKEETAIIAGDGKTSVKTALRETRLINVAEQTTNCTYISATRADVVSKIQNSIKSTGSMAVLGTTKVVTSFKMVPIERHGLFLMLAVLCIVLGFCFAEFHTPKGTKSFVLLLCLGMPFYTTGCSQAVKNAATVLRGKYQWIQCDYDNATATFLSAVEDAELRGDKTFEQYGLYGLATSYLMQHESDAAFKKLQAIALDAPSEVIFNTWYTIGIIQYQKDNLEAAAEAFKNALRINSSNINAKINYELAIKTIEGIASLGEQELIGINNTESLSEKADSVFSVIQENEEQRWKNSQQMQKETDVLDY